MISGVVWLSLFVLVENIQLVIILGIISNFVPIKMDPFNLDIFPVYQSSVKPSHQMLIYHIFIVMSILAQAAGIYAFRERLKENKFQRSIKQILCVEALWIFVQCFAILKILIYSGPAWAWGLLYTSLAGALLSFVFWPEIKRGSESLDSFTFGQIDPNRSFPIKQEQIWGPLFVLLGSIQMVIGCGWVLGRFKPVPFVLYVVFIVSLGLFSFLLSMVKKTYYFKTKPFIVAELIIVCLLLCALYKMVIYDYRNQLATHALHVLLAVAVLNKIFWPGLWRKFQTLWGFLTDPRNLAKVRMLGDIVFASFIILTIYIPDPLAVLAKMFIGDEFIHTNCFIMAPGWAYVKGCLLDVDVMARYGIGIPIIVATLAKWAGGYTYVNVFLVIMWICIVYYLLCYWFLRIWLKSFILAAAAIIVGIKTQMFYSLSFPQPFTYSSGTPARFMLDIIFMFFIWEHLKTCRFRYLVSAACCCGASFFCTPETGLYLGFAFYAYMVVLALVPDLRREIYGSPANQMKAALSALIAPGSAIALMWGYLGKYFWTNEFWFNFTEISKLYTAGFWMGPFYGGIQYGQFWDLLVGMSFPIVYVLTILIIGTLCILKKVPKVHLMAVVLCFYGLGSHHYYVVMATLNNYYPRGLPFVFIIFYWIGLGLACLSTEMRRRAGALLLAFCAFCLWSNHHYLSYPNKFNFSRNPMIDPLVAERLVDGRYYFNHRYINIPEDRKVAFNSLGQTDEGLKTEKDFRSDEEVKSYYKKETDFSRDVGLIRSLVRPNEPVALLSSYETEMLMQADRKPFYYYFRVFQSRPLRMRTFGELDIWTTKELAKLIDQMSSKRPAYIFMERIFLQDLTPEQHAKFDPGLMGLLDYVKGHYHPYAYGEYLVAMKRNDQ